MGGSSQYQWPDIISHDGGGRNIWSGSYCICNRNGFGSQISSTVDANHVDFARFRSAKVGLKSYLVIGRDGFCGPVSGVARIVRASLPLRVEYLAPTKLFQRRAPMCKLSEIKLTSLVLHILLALSSNKLPVVCRGFPMLKYVVVAVFSICALPCIAHAQSGSRGVEAMGAQAMGAQNMGAQVVSDQVMAAPMAESPTMAAPSAVPMSSMSAPMDMGYSSGSSDCGCGAAPAPAVADCGCGAPEPSCCAPRTRKKLALTKVSKEVCRLKRVCTTDCCGCPKKEWVRVKKTVCRTKLTCVDVPRKERSCCLGGRLKGMMSRLGSCGCRSQADDCGCGEPVADCGCGEPAPAADCGCGQAAPVADCGCGG